VSLLTDVACTTSVEVALWIFTISANEFSSVFSSDPHRTLRLDIWHLCYAWCTGRQRTPARRLRPHIHQADARHPSFGMGSWVGYLAAT